MIYKVLVEFLDQLCTPHRKEKSVKNSNSLWLMPLTLIFAIILIPLIAERAEAQTKIQVAVPVIEVTLTNASTSTSYNSFIMDHNSSAARPNFEVNSGEKVDLFFKASRATACQVDNPADNEPATGITLESNFSIDPNHRWYPAPGKTTTIKFGCIDRFMKSTETVVTIYRR